MHNAVVILQARMKSSRLPGKALAPLLKRPALEHVIRRVTAAKRIDAVVAAVSDDTESDRIAQWVGEFSVGASKPLHVARGPERDCIARFLAAAEACPANIYVRATADNPLVDPGIIDSLIALVTNEQCDYAGCSPDLSLGLGAEAFTADALRKVGDLDTEKFEKECVTYPMYSRPKAFRAKRISTPKELRRENPYRLTLDTEDDYELLKRIFEAFGEEAETIQAEDILNWLDDNSQIAEINKDSEQKPARDIDW